MQDQQQNDNENADLQPLANRIKHMNWQVRKRAYQIIQTNLEEVTNVKEQFRINNQFYTAVKLTTLLNNIVEEKHPILVLKGLQCILRIIRMSRDTTRYFNKLVCEGLEKFPLLTQQRKQILQKFMDILEFFRDQQTLVATLNTKLALPNQKSVMWVIQVIGALGVVSLKKKLIEISKKHPKKDVKDLAAQIAQQLVDTDIIVDKQIKAKAVSKGIVKKQQPKKMLELLDKIHSYEQLISKDQQKFAEELLESIDQISILPASPQLTNFSYYIQLMIEDNNQIISMGGVKMLTVMVRNKSQLLPQSYPLLFIFRKFKMHKTHATNLHLFRLVEQLLCSNRNFDLLAAISQGMCSAQNKVNLKYGCIMSFIRVFCLYYQQPQLFEKYCIGEYCDMIDRVQNRKQIQKIIYRCFQIFSREKDRQYQPAIETMKQVLGISINSQKQKVKSTQAELSKTLVRNKSNDLQIKSKQPTKSINPAKTISNINQAMTESPEGQLNKINEMLLSNKFTQAALKKVIDKCLKCLQATINKQLFDMFYYCEIVECFIDQYRSNQISDELISLFLIDYLTVLSKMPIKQNKKKTKITQKGVQYLLKISITKLVLSKNLLEILDNVNASVGYQVILVCLGSLLVMSQEIPKKKNKKYLNKWLEQNTPQQFINNQYFQIKQAIQVNGQKKIKKVEGPPSVINLPTYQQLKRSNNMNNYQQIQIISALNQQNRKEERELKQQIGLKNNKLVHKQQVISKEVQQLEMFQNADISNIEQIDEQETDRIDERWDYFLNKKNATLQAQQRVKSADSTPRKIQYSHHSQQQKFQGISDKSDESESSSFRDKLSANNYLDKSQTKQINNIQTSNQEQINIKTQTKVITQNLQENNKNKSNTIKNQSMLKKQEGIKYYYHPENKEDSQNQQQQSEQIKQVKQQFRYVYLDEKRITYMLSNSGKSFSHLRTLVFNPFKKQTNKHAFLRELTHLIQNQVIIKPQPYKSLLLLVIILFTEIKSDKTIIQPLQFLYEYMAQHCTNNEFLKTIIGLYHCAIQQTEQSERKFILTIMTKSMVRIMPYVQNAVQLLRDFQQFYQIGQLVYFQMYLQEYQQIRLTLQSSQNLGEVISKAFEQQGDNLKSIVQGWLQSGFKRVVKAQLDQFFQQVQEETQP